MAWQKPYPAWIVLIGVYVFLSLVTEVKAFTLEGSVTTCVASEAVFGEKARVHCFFPVDVYNKSFFVEKADTKVKVVNCEVTDVIHCYVAPSFLFTLSPGRRQTLVIPEVAYIHEGPYVCQMAPSKADYLRSCTLEIIEDNTERVPLSDDIVHGIVVGLLIVGIGVLIYMYVATRRRKQKEAEQKLLETRSLQTGLSLQRLAGSQISINRNLRVCRSAELLAVPK